MHNNRNNFKVPLSLKGTFNFKKLDKPYNQGEKNNV